MSIYAIRYYEKMGLLPTACRDQAGRRAYDLSILQWMSFLERMKASGMPLKEIAHYASLWKQGDGTEGKRRELLERHGQRIEAQIENLRSSLVVIQEKILDLLKLEEG